MGDGSRQPLEDFREYGQANKEKREPRFTGR